MYRAHSERKKIISFRHFLHLFVKFMIGPLRFVLQSQITTLRFKRTIESCAYQECYGNGHIHECDL